jgi:hypothetical protein
LKLTHSTLVHRTDLTSVREQLAMR